MLVSFIFGMIDALKGAGLADWMPSQLAHLPLSEQGLAWLVPSVMTLVVAVVCDRMLGKRSEAWPDLPPQAGFAQTEMPRINRYGAFFMGMGSVFFRANVERLRKACFNHPAAHQRTCMSFIQANLIHLLPRSGSSSAGAATPVTPWKARDTACLASVLHLYREDWMRRMLLRDNRIADASVIGNLERNASFFASSTLIILAGILTVLGASERAVSLLADIPMVQQASQGMSEIKLLCLALVFVYAFFTFSWCMRQYNFAAVLVGSAPMIGERHVSEQERKAFACGHG
jgi:hypothetical protein